MPDFAESRQPRFLPNVPKNGGTTTSGESYEICGRSKHIGIASAIPLSIEDNNRTSE